MAAKGIKKAIIYNSIHTTPMAVWLKVRKSGELSHLCEGKSTPEKLLEAWNNLYKEFINEFGASDQLKDFMQKQRELTFAILDNIENETIATGLKVQIKEREFAELSKPSPDDHKLQGVLYSQVERYLHFPLPQQSTMVYTFYNHVRAMKFQYEETQE